MSDPTTERRDSQEHDRKGVARSWSISFRRGRTWSRDQLALCAITVASALGYLACLAGAFGALDPAWYLVPAVFAVVWRLAGSALSLLYWVVMFFFWYLRAPDGSLTWWALPAAICAIIAHTATSLAATIPSESTLGRGVASRWLERLAIVIGLTAVVASAGWLLRGGTGSISGIAVILALALLAGGLFALRTNAPDTRD